MIPVKQLRVTKGFVLLLVLVQLPESTVSVCPLRVEYPRAMLNCSVGDRLTLNCAVLFCGPVVPDVHWCKFHSNGCQNVSNHHQLGPNSSISTGQLLIMVYTIPAVNLTDSGTYQCQARKGYVRANGHSIVVNVSENTKAACSFFVQSPRTVLNYSVGDSLTLNCAVQYCANGIQLPEAHWCKMHGETCQPVTGKIHYPNITYSPQDMEKKMLVIHTVSHVEMGTGGIYQCRATQGAVTTVGQLVSVNVGATPLAHSVWRWYSICRWIIFGLLAMIPILLCTLGCGQG
ncbi:netrin receptor DCC-like [Scyliorhinus torazame]|uniref:netrin receptor DCC-like n=1 Tax=Scyliorhinus torazame TaxID=75743 RepID=UPI003B5BF9BF